MHLSNMRAGSVHYEATYFSPSLTSPAELCPQPSVSPGLMMTVTLSQLSGSRVRRLLCMGEPWYPKVQPGTLSPRSQGNGSIPNHQPSFWEDFWAPLVLAR